MVTIPKYGVSTFATITVVKPKSYTVTFDTKGAVEISSQTVNEGEKATKPADPSKAGYEFAGWYTDEGCSAGNEYVFNTPVTADITIYAKWITKDNPQILSLTSDKDEYTAGETMKLTAAIDGPDGTKVIFVVSGKEYAAESDKGEAVVTIPLPFTEPGDYTITASLVNGGYKSITITVINKTEPKKKESSSSSSVYSLYTGTWSSPVSNGSWTLDASGVWHYTTQSSFRNTWGYIVNPYASAGQHQADWFWFDDKGRMLTGWQFIGGKWYYLNPTRDGTLGACQLGGITPDGWTVDESGAWIESIPQKKMN